MHAYLCVLFNSSYVQCRTLLLCMDDQQQPLSFLFSARLFPVYLSKLTVRVFPADLKPLPALPYAA